MNIKSPCLNCKYRTIECHSSCDCYKKYKENIEIYKARKQTDLVFSKFNYKSNHQIRQDKINFS